MAKDEPLGDETQSNTGIQRVLVILPSRKSTPPKMVMLSHL